MGESVNCFSMEFKRQHNIFLLDMYLTPPPFQLLSFQFSNTFTHIRALTLRAKGEKYSEKHR